MFLFPVVKAKIFVSSVLEDKKPRRECFLLWPWEAASPPRGSHRPSLPDERAKLIDSGAAQPQHPAWGLNLDHGPKGQVARTWRPVATEQWASSLT